MVVLHKARLTNGAPPALRWVLALTLGLGIGLLFAMPGTAWGISGYASGGSAVGAQYPDAGTALPPKPVLSDLAEVRQAIRGLRRTAQWQASQRALVQPGQPPSRVGDCRGDPGASHFLCKRYG
jgi:hypothetical protein